jgi:VPDSG-CTERM motif
MKSIKSLIALTAALLMSATVASAASYTFVDWNLQGLNSFKYLGQGQSYNGLWDISDSPGFSTSLNFTSAKADFWFADDSSSDSNEYVTIDIGSTNGWLVNEEVDGTISYTTNLVYYDLVTGSLSASLLLDIAADGKLSYKVTATRGDTYLKETRLTVYASTRNVPDAGSTAILFGLGLIGLAIYKRRQ